MRAAVLREFHKPVRIEEVHVEAPHAGEVLVRIAASGVCRSDLHVVEGRSVVAKPPMVLGHEGSGVVEEVGPEVRGIARGDHVVIALYGPCGECGDCRSGNVASCWSETRTRNMYGQMPDGSTRLTLAGGEAVHPMVGAGTLAEYALVREAQLVKVDRELPLELLCLAGCGVTTGIGAVLNTARVEPGARVAVIGCGGVGLNVVQGARIAGAARIIAIDVASEKLDLAATLGATDGVLAAPGVDVVARVKELVPGGVDCAFEVIGSPALVRQAFECTRAGGTAVMVGSPPTGEDIRVDGRLLFSDRRLLGCMGGGNVPQRDIPRIASLYRAGRLQLEPLVSRRLSLGDVERAFEALRNGDGARSVVLP
jgi:S-(hydroxymethyl)glutathione dehydrogenase/alcohol dehydrogenase